MRLLQLGMILGAVTLLGGDHLAASLRLGREDASSTVRSLRILPSDIGRPIKIANAAGDLTGIPIKELI